MGPSLSLYRLDIQFLQELGTGTSQRRDWKGITTALLVIFLICLLIFLCGYFFTPCESSLLTQNRRPSVHDNEFDDSRQLLKLFDLNTFRSSTGAPTWLKDGRLIFGNENGTNLLGSTGNYTPILTHREIHDILVSLPLFNRLEAISSNGELPSSATSTVAWPRCPTRRRTPA